MRKFLFDIESTGQLYRNKNDGNTFYLSTILGKILINKFFLQHLVNKNNKSYERKTTLSGTWNIYGAQPSPS